MTYNDKVVRQFVIMTIVWGIVGMLVGVIIAAQLWLPMLNFDIPWLTYGRLRPLHTNAVIFAFGGSALMGTSLYVVQRTCHVRLLSDKLAALLSDQWTRRFMGIAMILLAILSVALISINPQSQHHHTSMLNAGEASPPTALSQETV